jgi:hypothetical protein
MVKIEIPMRIRRIRPTHAPNNIGATVRDDQIYTQKGIRLRRRTRRKGTS